MSHLALFFLGPPQLQLDDRPLRIGRRKSLALLAVLATERKRHSRDALATLLWPGYDQSTSRGHLRRALTALNQNLGLGWCDADRDTVSLTTDSALWLDLDAFYRLLANTQAHAQRHPSEAGCTECEQLLTQALALYRDDFLCGFSLPDSPAFDEWQRHHIQRLRDELSTALERLAGCLAARGEVDQAVAQAQRWLELDPLHEPAHRCLMELYAAAGWRSEALRQYRECVRVLETELGASPSNETTMLYDRLRAEALAQEPIDDEKPAPAPPLIRLPAYLDDEAPSLTVARPVFVAREAELAWLDGHLEMALDGQGHVAFVTGGPGRGKTALLTAFSRRALVENPGLLVARGACNAYSGVGDPYLPFREVLAMLSGDVETRWAAGSISREHARRLWTALPQVAEALLSHGPHLIDALLAGPALLSRAATATADSPAWLPQLRAWVERDKAHSDGQQAALFEQFTNAMLALAARRPLLLVLDDLQWTDAGSAGLLFHLGRRLANARALIVGAYRPEEITAMQAGQPHPLQEALTEFGRLFGDVRLDLTQTNAAGERRFVDSYVDTEPNHLGEAFRSALHEHTGGHPLFTVELLRAMQERGELVRDADKDGAWVEGAALDWGVLPARVEAVIEKRVERLDRNLRDVLTVASVEGERFSVQVLAQVHGVPERDVVRHLSELSDRHRLVRESEALQVADTGRFVFQFQFAHALFQEFVYGRLSTAQRMLLHREVGEALETLYGEQVEEIAATLAHHYDTAGHREKAAEYALRAGDQARRAYASAEAITHFQRVLELLPSFDKLSFASRSASGADRTGDRLRTGLPPSPPSVRSPSCRGSSPTGGDESRLAALYGLGRAHYQGGKMVDAERCFRDAIALGTETDLPALALARIFRWLGSVLGFQGRTDERMSAMEQGLAQLENAASSSDAIALSETALLFLDLMMAHETKGNRAQANAYRERFLELVPRAARTPEYGAVFLFSADISWLAKDIAGARRWLDIVREIATAYLHASTLGAERQWTSYLRALQGDLRGALACGQETHDVYLKIGNLKNVGRALEFNAFTLLWTGDIHGARARYSQSLHHARATGVAWLHLWSNFGMGITSLVQHEWDDAADAFERSLQIASDMGSAEGMAYIHQGLGRLHLTLGEPEQAIDSFQNVLALAPGQVHSTGFDRCPFAAYALSGLEEAFDDGTAFSAFCRRLGEENPAMREVGLTYWHLEPTTTHDCSQQLNCHGFTGLVSSEGVQSVDWSWHDPFDDCSYATDHGLEIRAANGRDLWYINLGAPRLLRPGPAEKAFAVQTICGPVSQELPAIGGLLLWQDKENYLRLDVGTRGANEISFQGCVANEDMIIGRGRLSFDVAQDAASRRAWLQMERVGDTVRALCSADGEEWYTAGSIVFPFDGEASVQVGLHAIGAIDRSIYHGAYPDGTAIRFTSFEMWGA